MAGLDEIDGGAFVSFTNNFNFNKSLLIQLEKQLKGDPFKGI